jgi:hypothetical protein
MSAAIENGQHAPLVVVEKTEPLAHTIRIVDADKPRLRAKPAHVDGYAIYYKIGGAAPTSPAQCSYFGLARRSRVVVSLPEGSGNQTAWYIAVPVDAHSRRGPMSEAVSAPIAA